jgi:hypothetical protein
MTAEFWSRSRCCRPPPRSTTVRLDEQLRGVTTLARRELRQRPGPGRSPEASSDLGSGTSPAESGRPRPPAGCSGRRSGMPLPPSVACCSYNLHRPICPRGCGRLRRQSPRGAGVLVPWPPSRASASSGRPGRRGRRCCAWPAYFCSAIPAICFTSLHRVVDADRSKELLDQPLRPAAFFR